VHALLPDQRHAILDSVDAIGNLGKVTLSERLVLLVEGAIVAASQLQIVTVDKMWINDGIMVTFLDGQLRVTKQTITGRVGNAAIVF